MVRVNVDFTKNEDAPIIPQQFGVYICTYVSLRRILEDIPKGQALLAGGLRYDPGWGFGNDDLPNSPREIDAPQIAGTTDNIEIRWHGMEQVIHGVRAANMPAMFVHAYNPLPLQPKGIETQGGNGELGMRSPWNTLPVNLSKWGEIVQAYARRWREKGPLQRYHEIWNEPDLQPTFFTGTIEDYCAIYTHGSKAVRIGDPEGLVGGPAISFSEAWAETFLDQVQKNELPLDFFSYHTYGDPVPMVEGMRSVLRRYPWMNTKEILITEYNAFVPATPDFTDGGGIETSACAVAILEAFHYFLRQADIHQVYWAQLEDPEVFGKNVDRCGLLDLAGNPKPAYLAWSLFAGLPSQRRCFVSSHDSIHGMASADEESAQLLMWNRDEMGHEVELSVDAVPFPSRKAEISILHSEGKMETAIADIKAQPLRLNLNAQEICHIRLVADGVTSTKSKDVSVRRLFRYNHTPGASMYAQYDKRCGAVYMGSGTAPEGPAWIGLMLESPGSPLLIGANLEEVSPNGRWAVYGIEKDRGICYHSSQVQPPSPPWEELNKPIEYRPWNGNDMQISQFHSLLFYFEDHAPHARIRFLLDDRTQ